MIKARIRVGALWGDACILNIGERGLGLQSAAAPERGTYVEIRRGAHVIVGCVAWAKGHRFGVRTQDRLAVDSIIAEPEPSGDRGEPRPVIAQAFDRRAAPRPLNERAERSRHFGRAFEFSVLVGIGVCGGVIAFETLQQALAQPISSVSAALKPR